MGQLKIVNQLFNKGESGSETQILNALKSRDEMALSQLYDRYSSTLLGIISQLIQDQVKEEEILQSCFLTAWKSIDNYHEDQGTLFSWLSKIARSLSIEYLMNRDVKPTDHTKSTNPIVDINQNLNSLKQSTILNLVYFKGQDYNQVAEQLQMSTDELKLKIRSEFTQLTQSGS